VIHMTKEPCIVNTLGLTDDEVNQKIKMGSWGRCAFCKCVFEWDKFPDEKLVTNYERIGDIMEETVVGYNCPECGYKNNI
jgi:hypothetical protein